MSEQQILDWYNSSDEKPIYGYMYGYPSGKDDIIDINKTEVDLTTNSYGEPGFLYIWGSPGATSNFYRFADYGKTWAFSVEELI